MGDYGLFVWASFGLTLVAIGAEVLLLLRRQHAQRDDARAAGVRGRGEV